MKIGCSTVVFREFPLERALDAIRKIGYEYVEVQATGPWCPHADIWADDPVKYAGRVKAYGFREITALWMPDGALAASVKSVESGRRAVEWAAAAGIGVVNGGDGHKPEGMSDADSLKLIGERMAAILETAEKVKVYFALEPHGSFSLTAAGLNTLLNLVPSPWLGVNYDAANIVRAGYVETLDGVSGWKTTGGDDELKTLESVKKRVVHFHAKDIDRDKNCVAVGDGIVRLRECVEILRNAGYNGALSLETEGGMTFDGSVALAKRSFSFLNGLDTVK